MGAENPDLMFYLGYVLAEIADAFKRLHWPYLATALAFALWAYAVERRRAPGGRLGLVDYLAPASVFLHASAKLDYRFFLFEKVFLKGLLAVVLIFAGKAALEETALIAGLGEGGRAPIIIAYTVAIVLAYDFARFFAHWLMHKLPVLWEFHKVHHSAEVLTPITNYRMHPVDRILNKLFTLGAGAIVTAVFLVVFPGQLGLIEILGINAGQFLFYALASNLRHSHIWISYGPTLNHVLMSPAQHQIHHSLEERHWDKNMGYLLSVWDWMFGTLYVPRGRERFRMGLQEDDTDLNSVLALYFMPFKKAAALASGGLGRLVSREAR